MSERPPIPPAHRFFQADFQSSPIVRELGGIPAAIYALLIVEAMSGYLPDDCERVARRMGLEVEDLTPVWERIRGRMVETEHGLSFPKLEQDRERYWRKREAAAEAGRRSGRVRRGKPRSNGRSTAVEQTSNQPQPQPQPQLQPQRDSAPSERPAKRRGRPPIPKWRKAINSTFGKWWEAAFEESRGTAWAWDPAERAGVNAATGKALATLGDVSDDPAGAQRVLDEMERRAESLLSGRGGQDGWMAQNASCRLLASKWNELAVEVSSTRSGAARSAASVEAEIHRLATREGM